MAESNGRRNGRMTGMAGMAERQKEWQMAELQMRNGGMANRMAEWSNGGMVEWQEWRLNGGMAEWRNGGMAEWRNGGMAEWWTEWRNGRKNGRMVEWREWLPTFYLLYTPMTPTPTPL
jgi:hypothetical protein